MDERAPGYTLMGMLHRRVLTAATTSLIAGALLLSGCSSDGPDAAAEPATEASGGGSGAAAPGEASAALALEEGRTVIDVRTPEEYDEGHVEGAELIDIQGDSFDEQIAALDPDGDYVVYCRSGNRSAQAAERMSAAGLDVLDGGGLDSMLAAGWPPA